MKILDELTLRNLKMNKKRSAVIIIGIILSTALICGVAGIIVSFWDSMIEYTKITDGDYHVTYYNVPKDEIANIEENKDIEKCYISEELGYSYLKESENENKPYLSIMSMSDDYLNKMGLVLKDGRFPENSNELIISEHIKTNGGVEYEIGDEITLDISDRYSESGKKLTQREEFEYEGKEKLEKKYTKTFKIVGIVIRPNYAIEEYSAPGYTVITKMEEIENHANISVTYKNVKEYEKITATINEMEKLDENDDFEEAIELYGFENAYKSLKYPIELNRSLIMIQGQNLNDGISKTIIGISIVIVSIILVSSVFVIRNGFAISVTERFKTYGMLASIGATKKQLKKTVYFEGLILGLIAIPLGIISGIIAIWILLKVVNYILIDLLNGFVLSYKISLLAILISILVSSITILLSCRSSARRASKISPMDLIRSSKDIKLKAKKIKCPKIISKIFKIGGEIAYKNLKRSKKKYRTTVISIVVSITIFISVFSLIDYGFKFSNIFYEQQDYNMMLYKTTDMEKDKLYNIYNNISKLDNIEEYSIQKNSYISLDGMEILTDKARNMYSQMYNGIGVSSVFPINIIAVGDNQYKKYLSEIGLKYDECKGGAILYDTFNYYNQEIKKREDLNLFNLEKGDKITGKLYDSTNEEEITIKIVSRTNKLPFSACQNLYNMGGTLIVSDEYIEKLGYQDYIKMYINSKDANKLETDIKKYLEGNDLEDEIGIINQEKEVKAMNAIVLVISIFLYGFITVITLIGVTNIFNTITTNMNLRSKEFANLKSIGMTKKEFNRMIRLESIFYGSKSLIIGLPLGCIISYFIYKAVGNSYVTEFVLPFKAIIISIFFVLIVVGIIMKYSLNKINKQNIIETIRNDNI